LKETIIESKSDKRDGRLTNVFTTSNIKKKQAIRLCSDFVQSTNLSSIAVSSKFVRFRCKHITIDKESENNLRNGFDNFDDLPASSLEQHKKVNKSSRKFTASGSSKVIIICKSTIQQNWKLEKDMNH